MEVKKRAFYWTKEDVIDKIKVGENSSFLGAISSISSLYTLSWKVGSWVLAFSVAFQQFLSSRHNPSTGRTGL